MMAEPGEDDNFPNDFDGLDFDNIPGLQAPTASRCTPPPELPRNIAPSAVASPAPSNGSSSVEDMDSSFLAAVDALEARALGKMASGSESVSCTESDGQPSDAQNNVLQTNSGCSQGDSSSTSRKGKRKAEPDEDLDIRAILEGYEADLTCPICCDLLVGAQVANPCGHTCCGECSYGWFARNKYDPICAVCRTSLSTRRPLLPNFSVDNLVQQHLQALAKSGRPEWQEKGYKTVEWDKRLESWKRQVATRAAKEKSRETSRPRRRRTRARYHDGEYTFIAPRAIDESMGDDDEDVLSGHVTPRRRARSRH